MMEGSVEDLAKKIVDLEAQWDRWKEEKVKLEEEVMKGKREEEKMKKKYMKVKGKYMEIREKFDSEKMKLREENEKIREKYWEAETKKRELTIDLEAALSQQRGGDEGATEAEAEVELLTLKSLLEERDSKIPSLLGKIDALDRQNNRLERDLNDKMALVAKKMKIEEEENSKLIQKIQALERDKQQMVTEVSKLKKEKSEEVEMSFSVKKTLEAERKRSVEVEGENFMLAKKIEALNRQKDSLERDFKDKMVMEANNTKMEKEKNSELIQKIQALERDKDQMGAEVLKLQKEKSEEAEKSFSVKKALDAEKKRLVEVEGENFKLAKKIEALDRQKDILERDFKDKMAMEASEKKMEEEKTSKLIQALERNKEQIVAEVLKLQKEKSEEVEKTFSVKKALETEKKRSVELEGENFELGKKIEAFDRQKDRLERDFKDKMVMEAKKTKMEEEENSRLIQALERNKEQMLAEVFKLQKGKSEEVEKSLSVKKALEAKKKRLMEVEGENFELAKKIEALDRQNNSLEWDFNDKMAMEAKKMKVKEEENSKLIQNIQALERDREKMVAIVSKLQKEKSEEASAKKALEAEKKKSEEVEAKNSELAKKIVEYEREKKILEEKLAVEDEKMAYDFLENIKKIAVALMQKNETLEEEEMEAKLSRANLEKDAEIERISKEQMAMKEEGQKMEKEYIKVLYQQNESLEDQNKQLEMEKNGRVIKREEDLELARQAHLGSNVVGTLGTPAAQIQGNNKSEVQTPGSSAKRIQPLSGKLTGGRHSWVRRALAPS